MISEIDLPELLLRFGSAFVLTFAFFYLLTNLLEHRVKPTAVWGYLLFTVTLKMVWRWIIVGFIFSDDWPAGWIEALTPWVQPINQALYICMGIAVILLVYSHVRGRDAHHVRYHGRVIPEDWPVGKP